MGLFDLWKNVLTKPTKTFKREKKRASLGEGAKHVITAAIIGAILAIIVGAALREFGTVDPFSLLAAVIVTVLIIMPIASLILWLVPSGILFLFSKLLGGKSNYATQSGLIALYYAPITVISAVLAFIPTVGDVANYLVWIYSLYLLSLALREAHGYTTAKTILVIVLSFVTVTIILSVTVIVFQAEWLLGLIRAVGPSGPF